MIKKSTSTLISSLMYIFIGFLLAIFRDRTLGWVMTAAGVLFIVFSVLELIRSNWSGGAVSLIIGISIIVFGWVLTEIVILVLGILLAIKGVTALIEALRTPQKDSVDIIFSVLMIVIGFLLAFGELLSIMILIAGLMLILNGVLGLIDSLKKTER